MSPDIFLQTLLPEQSCQQVSVGRATERARFTELIDETEPAIRMVEVSGDPWIGKTRLLNEFISIASARGWVVAAGYAGHLLRRTPYAAIVDAVGSAPCKACGGVTGELPRAHACQFIKSISGSEISLRKWRSSAEPSAHSDPICPVLETLGSSGRLLLVIDDVHWADDASINLLHQLGQRPSTGRLLVVVAYRPRQAGAALWRMLRKIRASGRALRIDPAPLTDDQARDLLPGGMARSGDGTVLREAGGNPGLLRALATAWPASGRWEEFGTHPRGDAVSDCLRDFDALSELGWLVVRSAAVLEDPFEPELLERVAQVPRSDVLAALDELIRNDLVRADMCGRVLRFRNSLLRTLAARSAGPEWRLGARIRAVEASSARGNSTTAVTRHLHLGADPTTDVRATTARHNPQRPLRTTTGHEIADGARSPQNTLSWAETLATTGRITESLAMLGNLADDAQGRPAVRARIAWWRAWVWRLLGRHGEARSELRSALDTLPDSDAELRARLLRARLAVALESGDTAAEEIVGETAEMLRDEWDPSMDPTSRVHVLALLTTVDVRHGRIEQAKYRIHRAAPWLGEIAGSRPVEQLEALGCLGVAASAVALNEVASRCYERGLSLAERAGVTSAMPRFALGLGGLALRAGELARATWHSSLARHVASYLRSDFLLDAAVGLEQRIARAVLGSTAGRISTEPPGDHALWSAERSAEPDRQLNHLSRRELDIAVLVSDGRTNQQIARSLGLSHKTVETYLRRIFKKLAVSSRSEVATAVGKALVEWPPLPDQAVQDSRDSPTDRPMSMTNAFISSSGASMNR